MASTRTRNSIAIVTASRGTLLDDVLQFESVRCHIHSIVTDRACPAETVATRHRVPVCRLTQPDNLAFSDALRGYLVDARIDYALLLFPRLLRGELLRQFHNRILNLHPSVLPAFPGLRSTDKALATGARYIGNTVHLIDETTDGGPIVAQSVTPRDYHDEIATRHRQYVQQCKLIIQVVRWISEDRIVVKDGRAEITGSVFHDTEFSPNIDDVTALDFAKPIPAALLAPAS